jgi:multiple sugar transport system permease protein
MDNATLMAWPPQFNPFKGTIESYKKILSMPKYLVFFKNSTIVSGLTVLLCIITSIFAGYSLSRFRFFGRNFFMTSILSIQMFPIVAILISLYTFYSKLGLINTYTGLVLADTMLGLPLSIWLLKSFFDTIPTSLDESAKIDGCSRMGTLFRIIVPLLKPGLVAVGIYTFLQSWDDYLFGMIIMNRDEMRTLPVGIAQSFIGEFAHDYSGMMTLAVCASLPVILMFIFLQRYMVAGLTGGAVKG